MRRVPAYGETEEIEGAGTGARFAVALVCRGRRYGGIAGPHRGCGVREQFAGAGELDPLRGPRVAGDRRAGKWERLRGIHCRVQCRRDGPPRDALGHDVWQDLGRVYQADTRYTLTVAVGNRSGNTQSGNLSVYSLARRYAGPLTQRRRQCLQRRCPGASRMPRPWCSTPASNPSMVGETIRILLQARGRGAPTSTTSGWMRRRCRCRGRRRSRCCRLTGVGPGQRDAAGGDHGYRRAAPAVTFYYGTTDGGIDPSGWDESVALSGTHSGVVSTTVGGLAVGDRLFFHRRGQPMRPGMSWALPAESFETLALPPVVANLPAPGGDGDDCVTVGAEVTEHRRGQPAGDGVLRSSDGGTDAGAWDASVSLGSVSAQAVRWRCPGWIPERPTISGPMRRTAAAAAWAGASPTFATIAGDPAGGVEPRVRTAITGHDRLAARRGGCDRRRHAGGDDVLRTRGRGTTAGVLGGIGGRSGCRTESSRPSWRDWQPDTNYWFRCRARNAAGTVWAADSNFFKTTGLLPRGVGDQRDPLSIRVMSRRPASSSRSTTRGTWRSTCRAGA